MKSFCLTLSAFFVALGTLTAGLFYIPVGVSKCFPTQSLINCLAGVLIGPKKAAIVAFLIALLRNLLGTGLPSGFSRKHRRGVPCRNVLYPHKKRGSFPSG